MIFIGAEHPNLEDIFAPTRIGGTPVYLDVETDDVAGLFEKAVAAGADQIRAPTDPHRRCNRRRFAIRSVTSG